MLPQLRPYRFVDEIVEFDRNLIVAQYRLREDEFFFPAHFPGRPITPGAILLEAMSQCVTVQSYYLLMEEMGIANARQYRMLVTGAEVEWLEMVVPGRQVVMRSELLAWRMRRIRAHVKMFSTEGLLLAEARISGKSMLWSSGGATDGAPCGKTDQQEKITTHGRSSV